MYVCLYTWTMSVVQIVYVQYLIKREYMSLSLSLVLVAFFLACFQRFFLSSFFPIYILCTYLHWIHRWFEGKNTETKKKKIVEHRRSTDVNLCLWMSRSVLRLNVRVIYRMYVCWFSCSSQHENFIGKKSKRLLFIFRSFPFMIMFIRWILYKWYVYSLALNLL